MLTVDTALQKMARLMHSCHCHRQNTRLDGPLAWVKGISYMVISEYNFQALDQTRTLSPRFGYSMISKHVNISNPPEEIKWNYRWCFRQVGGAHRAQW